VLFSPRRRGQPHFDVLPAAGVSWRLSQLASPARPAVGDHGLLALEPLGAEEPSFEPTSSILARQGAGWIFAGSREAARGGQHYPAREVLAELEGASGCLGASVCEVPLLGGDGEVELALLVFATQAAAQDEAALRRELERRIVQELGAELLPDRFCFFPLAPRRDDDGAVDHDWCREQYLSGALFEKSRDPLHRTLAELRERLQVPATGPDGSRR
jgi:hypothetical protein